METRDEGVEIFKGRNLISSLPRNEELMISMTGLKWATEERSQSHISPTLKGLLSSIERLERESRRSPSTEREKVGGSSTEADPEDKEDFTCSHLSERPRFHSNEPDRADRRENLDEGESCLHGRIDAGCDEPPGRPAPDEPQRGGRLFIPFRRMRNGRKRSREEMEFWLRL